MNIIIKTIPHSKQRYPTVGDWITKKGKLQEILVSDMGNDDYSFLAGIHELIEAWLCKKFGVSQKEVDNFDKEYENARSLKIAARCGCKPTAISEPGNDKHAPYGKYHRFANIIEKMLAKALGVNWKKYEEKVNSL